MPAKKRKFSLDDRVMSLGDRVMYVSGELAECGTVIRLSKPDDKLACYVEYDGGSKWWDYEEDLKLTVSQEIINAFKDQNR